LVPIFALFSGVFLGPVASAQTYSRGVNMAGLEFNASVLPGAVNVNFTANGENSYTYFGNKGLTTIRVPFLWERIQPTLNGPLDATYKGDVGIVQSLLDQGADINMRNEALETLLDQAVCAGKVEMVRFLLERGAEVDPGNKSEWTPLHSAAELGHLEILRVLIDHGANPESRDICGLTPLHSAALYGHLEVCRMLIDHGANANARDRNHETPVHIATQFRHHKIVELLLERGAVVSRAEHHYTHMTTRAVADFPREHGPRGS